MQRSHFRHWLAIPIRWGDMDALKHVNNVQFFRYLESGRIAYFNEVLPPACEPDRYTVLADLQCAFRQQLHYPGTVDVGTRIHRLGNSSIHLHCAIFRQGDEQPAATARAVIVWYDFTQSRSIPLPAQVRQTLLSFEGMPDETS
ncbi:MAG: acyl-CoA thioesterase [Candidatus Competibacteraceae bacterium]|nr:acyl-CoA thioesterase [Candidatus Competibacteraceae bacterium]